MTAKLSGWALFSPIFFSSFALAVLQNVTVDDAAQTGAAFPTYQPSTSDWNQGNTCEGCTARPDASFAYDGTWHDMTFYVNNTPPVDQSIEFTFVGSGLYIFFILTNTIPGATYKITNISFTLDGVQASTFLHLPSTSTDYEYNQTVYANGSIPYGQHSIQILPINDTVNNVLFLFDYLIYTTETNTLTTALPSSSSTGTSSPSSGQNIGAIVGGTVAGAGILVVIILSLLWYLRRKSRTDVKYPPAEITAVEPFAFSHRVHPTSSEGISLPNQRINAESPVEFVPRSKNGPPVTSQPSNFASTVLPSSSGTSSSGAEILEQVGLRRDEVSRPLPASPESGAPSSSTADILYQVGLLRDEVTRMRRLRHQSWNDTEFQSEPPPEYS